MNADERRLKRRVSHLRSSAFICGSVLFFILTNLSAAQSRKLIEFGWDEPDTSYMRQHIATMEKKPFDGCVYHITYDKPDGTHNGNFLGECWGSTTFSREQFASAVADLKATPFRRFTHNF